LEAVAAGPAGPPLVPEPRRSNVAETSEAYNRPVPNYAALGNCGLWGTNPNGTSRVTDHPLYLDLVTYHADAGRTEI